MPKVTLQIKPDDDDSLTADAAEQYRYVLCVEGVPSGDNRSFAAGALTWRELPLPLMALDTTTDAHLEARMIGQIVEIERDGNRILGTVQWVESDDTQVLNLQQLAKSGVLRGVSIDFDNIEGVVSESDDQLMPSIEFVKARIMGATLCPFPAFAEAQLISDEDVLVAGAGSLAIDVGFENDVEIVVAALDGDEPALDALQRIVAAVYENDTDDTEPAEDDDDDEVLVASAEPVRPPAAWFERPTTTERTITPEGRIHGYLAFHDSCHIGRPRGCTNPPRSQIEYAAFHTGQLVTAEGDTITVGQITCGGGHADPRAGIKAARAHYDNVGYAVCDIRVGEDDIGIWYAGAMRPNVDPHRLREFMAADVSGDWRRLQGNLELVAICSVTVPGFPKVARSLVASGVVEAVQQSFTCGCRRTGPGDELVRQAIARSIGHDPRARRAAAIRTRFGI